MAAGGNNSEIFQKIYLNYCNLNNENSRFILIIVTFFVLNGYIVSDSIVLGSPILGIFIKWVGQRPYKGGI